MKIILWIITAVVSYFVGFIANCYVGNSFEFAWNLKFLTDYKTFLYSFFLFMVVLCIYLYYWYQGYWTRNSKKLLTGSEKDKHILAGLEQAHFQSDAELKKNFMQVEFANLSQTQNVGIPIKAEQGNGKLNLTFSKPAHTLIIGTTGSGKTTTFINPSIQILANTKDKPSMLISDPKGELFALHSKQLTSLGYETKVIDLRNPYNSIKWNPLEKPFLAYQKMLNLPNTAKSQEETGRWLFEDKEFKFQEEMNAYIKVRQQEICDEIYEDLHDIVSVLCPVLNKSEPIWESGAKNYILAILQAMLEDSEDERLGMTIEKFNFYNVMKIATSTDRDCEFIKDYFKNRSPISKAVSLSKQVLDASDKTRGSYLSTVFDKLSMFSDMSLCSLTSKNEIDFSEMATKPLALFLQIPDEKETRHTLASMIILQSYKSLVAKANTYPDLSLPRSVYFLLDEFGNLPRVHKLEQMITVGRSRKIWLALVVQSYAQLSKVYDEKSADIIRSNCNIQIFIGTTDLKTINDFSRLCGNFSMVQRNVSMSSGKEDVSSSASIKERPLIYPSELAQLNNANDMGNAIVTVFGFSPIRSKFTPSFRCDKYKTGSIKQRQIDGIPFDENKVLYEILKRNMIVVYKKEKEFRNNEFNKQRKTREIRHELTNFSVELLTDNMKDKIVQMVEKGKVTDVFLLLSDKVSTLNEDKKMRFNNLFNLLNEIENLEKEEKND